MPKPCRDPRSLAPLAIACLLGGAACRGAGPEPHRPPSAAAPAPAAPEPPEVAGPAGPEAAPRPVDLVVYDSTPGGLAAAIEAERHGLEALVLSPYAHLGGLSTSGLGATDVGHPAAIGGLAREFYLRLAAHYAGPGTPWQQAGLEPAFRFEPAAAETVIEAWVAEAGVEVWRGVELAEARIAEGALAGGPGLGRRLAELRLRDGRRIAPRFAVDASYEGDLLALCGVPFRVGREAASEYGESLAGSQLSRAAFHQFARPVDPYRRPGEPESGLLPELEAHGPVLEGAGDEHLQAFCFRLCLTQREDLRLPFREPAGYDPQRYELLLRWFEAGADWLPLHPVELPGGKTDTNNNGPVSSDWIGGNRGWLAADLAGRAAIAAAHRDWQAGLLWTLVSHPRVPQQVRAEAASYGHARDEFVDNGHWPYRLYVREGRRLVGDLVMTERHCRGLELAPEPIALAAYTMDSHHVRRLVVDGRVWNEGDVQVGGFPPYPIGYRAILPPAGSLTNLAVPVCLSASHIAYGSIRMEPVFWCLGHAAGAAIALAAEGSGDLQRVEYPALRALLLAERQALWFDGAAAAPGLDPAELGPFVLDDGAARFVGPWAESRSSTPFVGHGYRHDNASADGRAAVFELALPAGEFELELCFPPAANRAPDVPIEIRTPGEVLRQSLDQRRGAPRGQLTWASLGTLRLPLAGVVQVTIGGQPVAGHVVVDALRARPLAP